MAAKIDAPESAIIVPVEVPTALRRLRDGLDPSAAAGVPPHITLLYPFVPPERIDAGLRGRVARIIASESAFSIVLDSVGRWPDTVYLAPQPAAPFRRLTERLVAAFPGYPPYGGEYADIVAHLTVAHSDRAEYLAAAEHALPSLLPVHAVCREAWLIAHGPSGHWRRVWRLPLSAR